MRILMAMACGVLILGASGVRAASNEGTVQAVLGVPAYPSWMVHRLDDQLDTSGKTRLYQYQYVSHDDAKAIVEFYERSTGATASLHPATSTYTINTPDGAIVQIIAPPDGVPHEDATGATTTWTTLVTIIRFQAQ